MKRTKECCTSKLTRSGEFGNQFGQTFSHSTLPGRSTTPTPPPAIPPTNNPTKVYPTPHPMQFRFMWFGATIKREKAAPTAAPSTAPTPRPEPCCLRRSNSINSLTRKGSPPCRVTTSLSIRLIRPSNVAPCWTVARRNAFWLAKLWSSERETTAGEADCATPPRAENSRAKSTIPAQFFKTQSSTRTNRCCGVDTIPSRLTSLV